MVGIAFVIIKAYRPNFPVSEEQLISLVVVIVGYILGTAVESGLSADRPNIPGNNGPTQ
ncbi:MAG TPA: hypothetical protein VMT46_19410 [Anaerolineaceae bacterium]|nr:hypothetical protein [Anaerolineaceae bacterium]